MAGSSLLLASALIGGLVDPVINYAEHHGMNIDHGDVLRYSMWSSWLMGLPGIICLFYAVWKKFNQSAKTTPNG